MQTITQHITIDGARGTPCNQDGVFVASPAAVVVGQRCSLSVRLLDEAGNPAPMPAAAELSQRFVIGQDYDAATIPLFATSAVAWDDDGEGFVVDLSGSRTVEMMDALGTAESATLICELACYNAAGGDTPETPSHVLQWPILVLNRVDSIGAPTPGTDGYAALVANVAASIAELGDFVSPDPSLLDASAHPPAINLDTAIRRVNALWDALATLMGASAAQGGQEGT